MLAACAWMAVTRMREHDATIFDGLRTDREQRHYVLIGRSKTMRSNHLTGNSVDIVPYIDGRVRWDSSKKSRQRKIDSAFTEIAHQMYSAADILGISVQNLYDTNGWDKPHWNLLKSDYDIRELNFPIKETL